MRAHTSGITRSSNPTLDAVSSELPSWARVSERRLGHILRVTALLDSWAAIMAVPAGEAREWRDAGLLHDALRDAGEADLRALVPDSAEPLEMLHGPAAATLLEREGEKRAGVLEAIRWHTVGYADWNRTGRALYIADFLEPGRGFSRRARAFLAQHAPHDFDGVFREVMRMRMAWVVREGHELYPETVRMWNEVR